MALERSFALASFARGAAGWVANWNRMDRFAAMNILTVPAGDRRHIAIRCDPGAEGPPCILFTIGPAAADVLPGVSARMAAGSPFAGAGDAPPRLMLSAMFRNDPAYRRFFRLWQDMNLVIAAVFGDFLNMPLARTFELYELWCFLRLVRAAAEEFGGTFDVDDLVYYGCRWRPDCRRR